MAGRNKGGDLLISEVSVNLDTWRVTGVGRLPLEGAAAVHGMAARYLGLAESMLKDAATTMHLAYDPELVGNNGAAGRFITAVAKSPSAKAAIWETTEMDAGHTDSLIVLGPQFVDWAGSDEQLAELVAVDLTGLIETLYPLQCEGPIKVMMPYLTQIAGNVLIPGGDPTARPPSPAGSDRELPSRVEKAIARAYRSFADAHMGASESNQFGRLVTAYPAWQYLADTVGREAGVFAQTVSAPMSIPTMVYSIRSVIARAVSQFGIPVAPAAPVM